MVFEKVQKLLAEQLNIADVNSITMDSNIVTDLHADSLDVVELLMSLEDNFQISVPDEIADKLKNGEITESKAVLDYFFKTSAPTMSKIHPDIATRLDELSRLYGGIKDNEILETITNIIKETNRII